MPDAYTPALGLTKPEIGASRDTWGTKLNANMDTLDEFIGMAMPIGAVIDFAGPNAPPGWLICDGRLISRTTYSQLFAVIGTAWGTGDGSTNFALPPTPGRASVGPGSVIDETGTSVSFVFAQLRGAVSRPIAMTNLPTLNLVTDAQGYHAHGGATAPGGGHSHSTDVQGYHSHGGLVNYDGTHSHGGWTDAQGSHAHNISLPGIVTGGNPGAYSVMSPVFGNANYATDAAGNHSHNVGTYDAGWHSHVINMDGGHGHNISALGNFQLGIYADGSHAHNISIPGGGQAFSVLSPVLVLTKIIYAGQQAMSAAAVGLEAPLRRRLLAAPSRGAH